MQHEKGRTFLKVQQGWATRMRLGEPDFIIFIYRLIDISLLLIYIHSIDMLTI